MILIANSVSGGEAVSACVTDALGPALLELMAEKDIRKVTVDDLAGLVCDAVETSYPERWLRQ